MMTYRIRHAQPQDSAALRQLLEVYYREWSIAEQDTLAELQRYTEDKSLGFLVAESHSGVVGCVLGRPLDYLESAAECKRLYVEPSSRGLGIARALMQQLERDAGELGYRSIYLDSTSEFQAALALYRSLGYQPCERYNGNRQATLFFMKPLPDVSLRQVVCSTHRGMHG